MIVPIWKKASDRTGVLNATSSVKETLQAAGIKVKVDDSDQRTPGWKYNFSEMKGLPASVDVLYLAQYLSCHWTSPAKA